MSDLLTTVWAYAAPILAVIFEVLICIVAVVAVGYLYRLFKQKGINITECKWFDINSIIGETVGYLNQKVVNGLKDASDNGKLTEEEQTEVYNKAVNIILKILDDDQIKTICDKYGDITEGLDILIHDHIYTEKKYYGNNINTGTLTPLNPIDLFDTDESTEDIGE